MKKEKGENPVKNLLINAVWAIDDFFFNLNRKFFPKRFQKQLKDNPDSISFLTMVGLKIWMKKK